MASKRNVRRKACGDKKLYPTQQDAINAATFLRHVLGSAQIPYPCAYGGHWHLTTGYQVGLHGNKGRGKLRPYRGSRAPY